MLHQIKGLNGIRAFAVLMVIVYHRFPATHPILTFPVGSLAVDVFFVLSGYLISRILFNALYFKENSKQHQWAVLKSFVIRRALRIFPIYYLILITVLLIDLVFNHKLTDQFWWYFFYASNFLVYFHTDWFNFGHFWTLAVEEQFYLFWPLLTIYVFKPKSMKWLLLSFVGITILTPFLFKGWVGVLTPMALGAFAIGGGLAHLEVAKPIEVVRKYLPWIYLVGMVSLMLIIYNYAFTKYFDFTGIKLFHLRYRRLAMALVGLALVAYCRYHQESKLVQFLEIKPLIFIGNISYGIYLYHELLPRVWKSFFIGIHFDVPSIHKEFSYIEFFIQTLFIIGFSYLSFRYIEKPILKLKSKFNY